MTTSCVFSNPQVLDSSGSLVTPTDSSLPFQFSNIECTSTATDSGGVLPSVVSIASDSGLVVALGDFVSYFNVFLVFVLFICGFYIASAFFRR